MTGMPQTASFRLDGTRAPAPGAASGTAIGCTVALAPGRPGETAELMGRVVVPASDAAALVVGTGLSMDGGRAAD